MREATLYIWRAQAHCLSGLRIADFERAIQRCTAASQKWTLASGGYASLPKENPSKITEVLPKLFLVGCLIEASASPITTADGFCELDHRQRTALTDQLSKLNFWKIEEITASALCGCKQTQIVTAKVKPNDLA